MPGIRPISKTEIANGDPTMRGAVRVLTVGDNVGTVTETLTAFDDEGMSFSYVINSTDALPVQDYGSTVQVIGVGEGAAMVVWNADFLARVHPMQTSPRPCPASTARASTTLPR